MTTIFTNKPLPERRAHDLYPTPRWAVEAGLKVLKEDLEDERRLPPYQPRVLDVGAGSGIWGQVARELWPDAVIVGVEIRPECERPAEYDGWETRSFPDCAPWLRYEWGRFDLVIGNPPFEKVESTVHTAFALLKEGGRLAFFLRLAFLEGQRRRDDLFRGTPLKRLAVYSKRVSFQPDGKTNATAHALFLWEKGHPGSDAFRFL